MHTEMRNNIHQPPFLKTIAAVAVERRPPAAVVVVESRKAAAAGIHSADKNTVAYRSAPSTRVDQGQSSYQYLLDNSS